MIFDDRYWGKTGRLIIFFRGDRLLMEQMEMADSSGRSEAVANHGESCYLAPPFFLIGTSESPVCSWTFSPPWVCVGRKMEEKLGGRSGAMAMIARR